MKYTRKILTMILAMAISVSHILPVYADTSDLPENGNGEPTELELEDLDPSTLHIHKLGEVEEQEEPEEEISFDFNQDDMVRVSIVLDKPSTIDAGYSTENIAKNRSAVSYRDSLIQQQAQMAKTIERKLNRPLDVKWNLTLAANIISANVRYGDINKIRMIDGVKRVFLENRYEAMDDSVSDPLTANTSTGMVGATAAWTEGYTGAGSRIAIIDTGLDKDHQSVNADAFERSLLENGQNPTLLTRAELNSLKGQLNSGSSNYISSKIPYGYNYVDGNTDITHLKDQEGEHGSHVAGIAAANRLIKQGNNYVDAASTVYAVGMAPDAQLIIMKVFGKSGGAYDSDYFAAIEDAIVLGCDSANLSLGSGYPGFTYAESDYQEILNNLSKNKNNKMVVAISAGNSYGLTQFMNTDLYVEDVSMHTGGSPGTYINSLGVAAAENIGTVGAPLVFNGNNIFYSDSGSTSMTTITGSWPFVYIDALGEAVDYQAVNSKVSLKGKIVIVNRGDITFVEKGNNAVSFNPKALIIANNENGTIAMGLDDFTGKFPMVSISLADAIMIKNQSTSGTTGGYTYYTGTISVTGNTQASIITARENAEMTVFSSWGVPGSLLMKPEIVAPGGNIYSLAGENYYNGVHGGGQDQYEFMSGTSMAAPHITGLAAVVAQYVRENDFASKNSELVSNYSVRAIVQSLLMSTATPMKNNGKYVSILQQGAGLAEVHNAVKASSVIMMSEKDGNLTSRTGAAADGKVKVEFGDDPDRNGNYTYSFRIFNISDTDLSFNISTDLFTQATYEEDGAIFMDQTTVPVDARVNYTWEPFGSTPAVNHDVDRDGDTDIADAQLLADYLSGKVNESALDRAAGEMDGDGELTSHDIYLLLNWESEEGDYDSNVVPAHSSREVTVTINISDTKINDYPKGFYVEGYTKVESNTVDNEGVDLSHIHTIPLLGFYGSWTDPSMFDNTSYTDTLYGTEKVPYTGKSDTNYLTVTYNGNNAKFSGNPYITEEKFPYNRLAVNGNSQFNSMLYSLYRSAGTTGFAISRIDEYDGQVTEVLDYRVTGNEITGLWYSESAESWQNTNSRTYSISTKPGSIGLKEGDMFRIGFYAIPEYNAMITKDDLTNPEAGLLTGIEFKNVLLDNELGKGAFIGYDFVVDNTAPQINTATLSNTVLTVSVEDDRNLAYVAVLSLDGSVKYYEKAPGTKNFTVNTDIAAAISRANGYVVAFAGDYAGNEAAVAIKVNNNGTTDPYNVNSISLNPNSLNLYKGNIADVTATVLPLTASDRTVTWSSSNPAVATVDGTGHVTAIGSGSTTIKATSNANSSLSASCNIKVTVVDKALNGIVWDEDGGVYFSGFNTNSLPTWTKLHSDDKQLNLQSAFMQSTSKLYAATLDTGKQESVLYTVNRSSYDLTEYGTNFVFATDMAIGASGSNYRKYIGFSYVFATYLVAGPIAPSDDGDGNMYCGLPIAVLDCSEKTGGAYFAGIACKKRTTTGGEYYMLDENGTIWQSTLSFSSSNENGFVFSDPEKILETGISTSFLYQNLYCDSNNIYWSHYDGDSTEMIIINISSKSVYHAGNFGENVWPVAGLYVNGKVAPNTSEDVITEFEESSPDIKPVMSRSELLTDEISDRYQKETDRYEKSFSAENETLPEESDTETVSVTVGSTQVVSGLSAGLSNQKILGIPETSDGISAVALKESKATSNGIYTLEYDMNVLGNPTVTFTDSVLVRSYYVDEANGIITFVYADKKAMNAETVIANVTFSAICDDTRITLNTRERNDELLLIETEVIGLRGKGHDWSEPVWSWDNDFMHATATFTCRNDASHQESIRSAEAVIEETAPTHDTDGKRTYTVSVTGPDGKTYQDEKEITLPALGYDFEFTEFRWSDDYSKADAVYTDKESGETRVITVNSTAVTIQATCTEDGSITYTVFISAAESFDSQQHSETKVVAL
ncbi:MAG: S8 family serine peptidase, partial [Erysipelotrichaceae bacterium]|nr:S8 family serine peptidase [Erysipelotrichaceae bacterium]